MEIFLAIDLLAIGFILLIKGADWFVEGAAGIAARFGIPQLVIGLTIVAMGTSAPEAAVSITAARSGNAGITIGNVVGSNIMNILVILGITAVITTISVQKSTVKYEIPFMLVITLVLLWLGWTGNEIVLWEGMSPEEKYDALYEFTKESLTEILDAGVDVGMVQIGNEINNGMAGETLIPVVMNLLISGSQAVREISESYGKDIQIVVHYTNIEDADGINTIARNLMNHGVDYDIFGLSYYPFWDGTNENMQNVAKNIQEKYGKKVMIAETSYCYTAEDGDGCDNSLHGTDDLVDGYAASVQSQATMIRDVCETANDAGVIGVFYWEGTWIPVGKATEDNSPIWEEFGSGWASSYAADYDPEDAGLYYGGCSWDNQAMFDFNGYPLASLNVFKYLKYGSTAPLAIDYIPELYASCDVGGKIELPEKVDIIYNDRSANTQAVVAWDEAQIAAIDTNVGGDYDITGTIEDGTVVTCHVKVVMLNHAKNPSFEDADTSMWKVTYEGENNPTDFQVKADDAYSGETAFHFWSEDSNMEFAIEQELTDLEPGTYQLFVYAQGGDMSEDSVLELYAVTNGEEQVEPFMVTNWGDWQNPTIPEIKITDGTLTIGVRIKCNARSWGTVDDFTLNRIAD